MATRDSGTWCNGNGPAEEMPSRRVYDGDVCKGYDQLHPAPSSRPSPYETEAPRAFCGTVLVADITNHSLLFTPCKETAGQQDTADSPTACILMRTLHERLLPVVITGAGNVNVTRDGVTAAYADTTTETAARRAMRDALELRARTTALLSSSRYAKLIPPGTGLRIAIVTGAVHLVPIEPPLAHASRTGTILPFIMGDTVSLATRLCASSFLRPDGLALCDTTYRALQGEPGLASLHFAHRMWRPTPGTTHPIHLFQCRCPRNTTRGTGKTRPPTRADGARHKSPCHCRVPSARS
jgi:class 3 adenylate cyclase